MWGDNDPLAPGVTEAPINPSWLCPGGQAKDEVRTALASGCFPSWVTGQCLALVQVALTLVRTWGQGHGAWSPSKEQEQQLDSNAHCSAPPPLPFSSRQACAVWPALGGAVLPHFQD